jgi:hypothetical protein
VVNAQLLPTVVGMGYTITDTLKICATRSAGAAMSELQTDELVSDHVFLCKPHLLTSCPIPPLKLAAPQPSPRVDGATLKRG